MPQLFIKVHEMMKKMKEDLAKRTFPHLLMNLATASKVHLQQKMAEAATKNKGKAPAINTVVAVMPPPGISQVNTKFTAHSKPKSDERSIQEAEAYKEVYGRFNEVNLASKAMVLKLLASVGVM